MGIRAPPLTGMRLPSPDFGDCGGHTVQLCLLQYKLMSIEMDWHARMSPPFLILGVPGDIHLPRPALFALAQIDVEHKGWT